MDVVLKKSLENTFWRVFIKPNLLRIKKYRRNVTFFSSSSSVCRLVNYIFTNILQIFPKHSKKYILKASHQLIQCDTYITENSQWIVVFKRKFLKFYLMRVLWAFKGAIRGIGAPTPIFEPYISSYNHIFDQNATKLHFLYSTKLVG